MGLGTVPGVMMYVAQLQGACSQKIQAGHSASWVCLFKSSKVTCSSLMLIANKVGGDRRCAHHVLV